MHVGRAIARENHKTPCLKFNSPFNIAFEFHFMLSKARITEAFTGVGLR